MFQFKSILGTTIKVYWVVGLLFVLATYLIVIFVKYFMLKSAIQKFNKGITDASLAEKCEKQKKFYRSANTVAIYDLLCCMVAAISLTNNEQNKFVDNIQQIKKISGDTEHRLRLLFLAYLTNQKYIDLSFAYQKQSPNEKGNIDLILKMYAEYKPMTEQSNRKINELKTLLKRDDLLKILHSFD